MANGNIVGLDLNLNEDFLANAVKQTLVASIAETINKDEITNGIVASVLFTRCREDGSISSWQNDNKYTLIEVYVRRAIKDTAKELVAAEIENMKPIIKEKIKEALNKKSIQGKMVDNFIAAVCSSLSNPWRTNIDISFTENKEE